MSAYFEEIGMNLDSAWRDRSYNEEIFPMLAVEILSESPPAGHVTIEDIIASSFLPIIPVPQPDDFSFGQPPIKLFQGNGFYIEALFWIDSTTAIHEHAFSGAFTPIFGSSVHSEWSFVPGRKINSHFKTGHLTRTSMEILTPGLVRPIQAGSAFIHQLFHLETPSVTIVIRTDKEQDKLPQFSYYPPGVAIDPHYQNGVLKRQLALLGLMMDTGVGSWEDYAELLLTDGNLEAVYQTIQVLDSREGEQLVSLKAKAREKHGSIVDLFGEASKWKRHIVLATSRRKMITNPEHRYFLALLMLAQDRGSILEAVALKYPNIDPKSKILEWMEQLSGVDVIGIEFDEVNSAIFKHLLDGCDTNLLLERLAEDFDDDDISEQHAEIIEHAARLATLDLFFPLFGDLDLGLGQAVMKGN